MREAADIADIDQLVERVGAGALIASDRRNCVCRPKYGPADTKTMIMPTA